MNHVMPSAFFLYLLARRDIHGHRRVSGAAPAGVTGGWARLLAGRPRSTSRVVHDDMHPTSSSSTMSVSFHPIRTADRLEPTRIANWVLKYDENQRNSSGRAHRDGCRIFHWRLSFVDSRLRGVGFGITCPFLITFRFRELNPLLIS